MGGFLEAESCEQNDMIQICTKPMIYRADAPNQISYTSSVIVCTYCKVSANSQGYFIGKCMRIFLKEIVVGKPVVLKDHSVSYVNKSSEKEFEQLLL